MPVNAFEEAPSPFAATARIFTVYVVPLVKLEAVSGEVVPAALFQVVPLSNEYLYESIGAFASAEPAVKAIRKFLSPAVIPVIVGAPGSAAGCTRTLGEEAMLLPATLVATTE